MAREGNKGGGQGTSRGVLDRGSAWRSVVGIRKGLKGERKRARPEGEGQAGRLTGSRGAETPTSRAVRALGLEWSGV